MKRCTSDVGKAHCHRHAHTCSVHCQKRNAQYKSGPALVCLELVAHNVAHSRVAANNIPFSESKLGSSKFVALNTLTGRELATTWRISQARTIGMLTDCSAQLLKHSTCYKRCGGARFSGRCTLSLTMVKPSSSTALLVSSGSTETDTF